MPRDLKLASLDEALAELDRVERSPRREVEGAWTLHQHLVHCAQGIEGSMVGFTEHRSRVFKAIVGRIALSAFLRRGRMSHDLAAPIPGAPDFPSIPDPDEGLGRLRAAIASFRAFAGELQPHFAYGVVTKPQYEKLHAMHIANHLGAVGLADLEIQDRVERP